MEDHMTSSDAAVTGSSSVAMGTDSVGAEPDLQILCNRLDILEQKAGPTVQPESYLRNRIRQLERSERSLLLQLYQLASSSQLPSMQHSQRLDQRLHMLREEVRNMTQEKERGERVWRDRLQRCQRQLKVKEEEMTRQSQYFENFKTQLQHKLSIARDREQRLQNRIYTLEKQLLDMTVSAASGMASIRAIRITAGTVAHLDERDRLPSMREEGEGEEEKKEEKRKQWQTSVATEREERREGDEGTTEKDTEGGRNKDIKQASNEARLQGFIISLQEDLRVLLEREEDKMTEQRGLMEQLQKTQENSHFLGCKVEEMKAEVHQLKLSESSLMDEVEELREENQRLQQILRDAPIRAPSQSSTIPEFTCPSPGTSSPCCSPAVCSLPFSSLSYTTTMGQSSAGSLGEIQSTSDEERGKPHSSALPSVYHQAAAESKQTNTEDHPSSVKSKTLSKIVPLNLFHHVGAISDKSIQSLSMTTESLGEFKLGNWCTKGILNLEESPSEESDALREAYRSLGFSEDLSALQEQHDDLEVALQHTQDQLQVLAQENAQLKLQLRKQAEEQQTETKQECSKEKINTVFTNERADHLPSSSAQDDTILALAQGDLVKALNQENRALADRIQKLLAHIELREEEFMKQQTQLSDHVSRLEEDAVRLEQENQEQGCLISELTRKTEDDLNTIMELQQKLVESVEHQEESQGHKQQCSENRDAVSGGSVLNIQEECINSLVESVLKGEEKQLIFSQKVDTLTTSATSVCQHDNNDSLQNSLHVTSLTDQVVHLNNSIQSLKTEQEELAKSINSLQEQQREVALSVQTQTEEKQQLTRTIWGLKEEKDCISQCLAGLKQEKEQLSRTVCGLKDERDQFIRSMSGLKEEKEQLTKSLSALERDKEAIIESLSSGKEEGDQIMQSLQSLQTESEQVSQAVLYMKEERDKLTNSLKCLKEQRDQEQLSHTLKEDQERLIKSVSSLEEEKGRIEHSISCLKQEEEQLMLTIRGLREERKGLQTLPPQIQTEERNQKLLNPSMTKKTETFAGSEDYAAQRCQTNNHRGTFIQEQSNLRRETEALGTELKRSQEELDKSLVEIKRLRSELRQSETRREETEKRAIQAAEEVARLTVAGYQMEETRRDNDNLTIQVKELQRKLTGLLREKTDALSLRAQIEEQYNILTAQLKAQTVALEELNSEYIALKRGQGSRDDLSAVLVSLRSRYSDIRAKYDALLKRKSQTGLDIAPLKAKLSCLVVKCQERNSLLVQMMKAMHRHGCIDPKLTEQVEHLLSDAALHDYTAAFTPGSHIKTRDYCTAFTPDFISKFQDYTSGFIPDQTNLTLSTSESKQQENGVTPGSTVQGSKSEKHIPIVKTESSTNLQGCSSEVSSAGTLIFKKNANSPVPTSPVQEHATVQGSSSPVVPVKESLITNKVQLSSSASGPVRATSRGVHHVDTKGMSSPDSDSLNDASVSPIPPSSSTRVSPSRRLSSPEKILNLHEQLQKTLMSSCQAPVSRGRGQQPRRSLSLSAPADLNPTFQTHKQNLSFNTPQTNSLPVTTASGQAKHALVVPTTNVGTNKSATLFNAVASRSANATFSPSMFTNHRLKADISKTTMLALSSSSTSQFSTVAPNKVESISSSQSNIKISPKLTEKITAVADVSVVTHKASTTPALRTTTFNSDAINPKTTAPDTTAPSASTAPKVNIFNMSSKMDGAASVYDSFGFTTSCTQSAHCSPERSNKSTRKFTPPPEKTKPSRPKPGAPAEVRSLEVIRTVGQSSLMIGWERPPLDELGCSNGTFVYGYRVFVDGDFHKSVMSSACTKCVLENVDLSVPVHISVQTLGSNGLSSNSVHTMYRTSVRTDQHGVTVS
ncbi:plectin-like [Acanthochromis polyacanthus]|uniref:plectin-like n=1 Tax=Acanthochromis polyacanthus TaxID=80966 RepID=UPI0022347E85|nr:plectin-like [Acanthochromis polyacanthus]XP_051810405.1 plectin-like [Acanthochromis polyacanthus]